MEVNTHFIPQNVSAGKAHQIGVYNDYGRKVGHIPLGTLAYPSDIGKKLYSFGALSDIHLGTYCDADGDFQRALTYLNDAEKVDFTCICGDLTNYGNVSEYEHYRDMVETYSPNVPVYAISGNHDSTMEGTNDNKVGASLTLTKDGITPYTGNPLYYSFTHGSDVFIMIGQSKWAYGQANADPFLVEELQFLYDTLEANRDKRCFVFQHCLRFDGCGKPYAKAPTNDLLASTQGAVFKSIVSHYPNVIWFHGHSHMAFDSQEDNDIANYDNKFGCHSVHIPSLAYTREYADNAYSNRATGSEGYIVDVYQHHIVLRGREFTSLQKFLPIATYCIDTTFTPVAAGTLTDSTGTIET